MKIVIKDLIIIVVRLLVKRINRNGLLDRLNGISGKGGFRSPKQTNQLTLKKDNNLSFTKQILAPINQCSLTGLEKKMYNHNAAYTTYQDCQGRIRMVFSHRFKDKPDRPVCGLFLEKIATNDYKILGVYTVKDERRRGFARTLLSCAKLRLGTVRHAESLTHEGMAWRDSVEGLKRCPQ